MKKQIFLLALPCLFSPAFSCLVAQPNFTANQQVAPYTGGFHPAVNNGYFPGFTNEQLAEFCAGNLRGTVPGAGARSMRFGFTEEIGELFGYDILTNLFEYYAKLGMKDHCVILQGPVDWHRDAAFHCPQARSALFKNLYSPIWDGGANGTPYNDDNYFAAYCHKMATLYKPYVKFWEIWNEPGFDLTGSTGWLPPGYPKNWWQNNPEPCDYILRAPVQHYIRTLRIAWEVIKTVDPQAYVTCSGVGYPAFLDAVLRQTDNPAGGAVSPDFPLKGGAYFDAVGFHSYPHFDGSVRYWDNGCQCMVNARHSDGAADGAIRVWNTYKDVLNTHGYNGAQFPRKVQVITEGNIPAKSFVWGTETLLGGVEVQRNFVMKALANLMKNDIVRYDLFQIFNRNTLAAATEPFEVMGLYERTLAGQSPNRTPEGIAYKTASAHLFNTVYDVARTAALNLPANVGGCAFRTPANRYVYMLWAKTQSDQSENAAATYSFPGGLGIANLGRREWDFSQTGNIAASGTSNLSLGSAPVFFTDDAAWGVSQPNNNPKIDLQLALSASPANPVAGGNTTWSLTLTNNSVNAATNVKVLNFLEFGKQFLLDRMTYVAHNAPPGTVHNPLTGTWTIPTLPAGQSLVLQITATVRHNGPYRAFAQVGSADQPDLDSSPGNGQVTKIPFEDDEADYIINNNGFMDTKADMVIEATTLPASVVSGATFTTTFMQRNNGRTDNPACVVKYYLSTDNNLSANDPELGSDNFAGQNAFGYETKIRSLIIPAGTASGNYFVLFRADANGQVDEFDENNVFARPINITGGGGGGSCVLAALVSNVQCNDNGTPANATDDTFTFDVTVSKTGTCGNTWSGGPAGATTTGAYGVAKAFGPFPINGGNKTLVFNDISNPAATTTANAIAPAPCSSGGGGSGVDLELTGTTNNANAPQWSFFSVTFSLKNIGTAPATNVRCQMPLPTGLVFKGGDEFAASQGSFQTFGANQWTVGTLNAGATATLTLHFFNLTATGKSVYGQVTGLDQTDSDSQPNNGTPPSANQDDEAAVSINGGGGGGPVCSISSSVSNISCNNNGTPTLPGDDTFTFDVTVSKSGTCGNTWSGGPVGATTTGTYGVAKNFGPFPISGGNKSLTFNDVSNTSATTTANALAPAPCSSGGGGNKPDLELTIMASPQNPGQWKNITLTLTLKNVGGVAATGVLVDFLDQSNTAVWSKIGFVSHTAPAGTNFNSWTGRWTVGTLNPGQTLVLTYGGFTKVATSIPIFGQVVAQTPADLDSSPGNNNNGTPAEDDEALILVNNPIQNLQAGSRNEDTPAQIDILENVQAQNPSDDLFLFPNPADRVVTIIFPENWIGKTAIITLLDTNGKTALSLKSNVAVHRNLELDISALPEGIFVLRANQTGQRGFVKNLIVKGN